MSAHAVYKELSINTAACEGGQSTPQPDAPNDAPNEQPDLLTEQPPEAPMPKLAAPKRSGKGKQRATLPKNPTYRDIRAFEGSRDAALHVARDYRNAGNDHTANKIMVRVEKYERILARLYAERDALQPLLDAATPEDENAPPHKPPVRDSRLARPLAVAPASEDAPPVPATPPEHAPPVAVDASPPQSQALDVRLEYVRQMWEAGNIAAIQTHCRMRHADYAATLQRAGVRL